MAGRTRKKTRHNRGRQPLYKDLRRNAVDAAGRVCDTCATYKPLTEFYKRQYPDGSREWHYNDCKQCCVIKANERKTLRTGRYYQLVDGLRAERAAPHVFVPVERLLQRRRMWSQCDWSEQDKGDVRTLIDGNAPIDRAADAIGRSPRALVDKARSLHIPLPDEWLNFLDPARPERIVARELQRAERIAAEQEALRLREVAREAARLSRIARDAARAEFVAARKAERLAKRKANEAERRAALLRRKPLLQFPFIAARRDEHADLLRVNALVPRQFSEHMRADICQNIMLAIYEGQTTIAELEDNRANLSWFVRKWYNEQSPYDEISVEGEQDDDRPYTDIAADVWQSVKLGGINDARPAKSAFATFYEPTQIDDVFRREVSDIHRGLTERGAMLSRREAAIAALKGRALVRDFRR